MKRYCVVTHRDQVLSISEGKIIGKQPIHDLVSNYHWFRLDVNHIFMVAEYPMSSHAPLHAHALASMLPHVSSAKPIQAHLQKTALGVNKDNHWQALQTYLGLADEHTIEDVIDIVVSKHGPLFAIHT